MTAVVSDAVAASAATDRLKLTEIFLSLQGEARDAGWPTVFVRLTGCPLRCTYCDTAYAFHGGDWWSIDDILADVAAHAARPRVVVGFAAETDDVDANARLKLAAKGADLIAANRVGLAGSGFEGDENTLVVHDAAGSRQLGPDAKSAVATALVALIAGRLAQEMP